MSSKIVGAVDIGTSKIQVFIGDIVADKSLNIIGKATVATKGVKKSDVIDSSKLNAAFQTAIALAEKSAGTTISNVYISTSAPDIDGFLTTANVSPSSPDNKFRKEDINLVCKNSKSKILPNDRVEIHYIKLPFLVDDIPVKNPIDMLGRNLSVSHWCVHANKEKITNQLYMFSNFNLKVENIILSSIASSKILLTNQQKQDGVLLLDIGAGVSDFVLFKKGFIVCTGVLPIGGDHITNDISLGLRISRKKAEKIKIAHGSATITCINPHQEIWIDGDMQIGDKKVPLVSLEQIISARVEELFLLIKERILPFLWEDDIKGGIMITGGSSNLKNIEASAQKIFGLKTSKSKFEPWLNEEFRQAKYATSLGLLQFALSSSEEYKKKLPQKETSTFFKTLKKIIKSI